MAWFPKLCRQAGLLIHHVVKPVDHTGKRQEISRTTQEKKVSPTMTLRRTTIDEIELKKPTPPPQKD
jgi:hypothetical protein